MEFEKPIIDDCTTKIEESSWDKYAKKKEDTVNPREVETIAAKIINFPIDVNEMEKSLKEIGINIRTEDGKYYSMSDILILLSIKWQEATAREKTKAKKKK